MAKKLPTGSTAIVGAGTTRYGNLPGLDQYDLGAWALKEALADAGLTLRDIDGLIVSRIADWHRPALVRGDVPGHAANELLDAADGALDFLSQGYRTAEHHAEGYVLGRHSLHHLPIAGLGILLAYPPLATWLPKAMNGN